MNADALITSLGSEAAREEVMSELDGLLAAYTAGTLRDEELSELEARAGELPELRRTLDAYAPLGAEVAQRIVGALRGVLGREPTSGRRSITHDSDVMRPSNVLHDSALPSWGTLPPGVPAEAGSSAAARSGVSSLDSEARALTPRARVATHDAIAPRDAMSTHDAMSTRDAMATHGMFDRLAHGSQLGSGVSNVRATHDAFGGDAYTDHSAANPGPGGPFPVDGEEAFEQLMRQSYADGQQAWPTLKVGYDSFSRHVRRAVGETPDWHWQTHAGDLYLCCACALGDRDATRLLDTQILPRAAKAIARIESDAAFVDEALQILRHKLFVGPDAKISVYSGRGSLTAWLRVTATRVALDGLRALGAQRAQQVDLQDRMAQPSINPLNDLVKSRYAEAFQEALRVAIRELSVRDRNLLRLRLVGHCGIDQLGQMYRVHRATAARWLKAAHTRVFDSVREQLRARFQLSDDEFDQMALDMQSRLELSLSGLAVDGTLPLDPEAAGEHAAGEHAAGEHAAGEHAAGEPAAGEPAASERSFSGQLASRQASSEQASTSHHSPELEHSRRVVRHEDDELPRNGVSWSRD